jgi:hypothetical protein
MTDWITDNARHVTTAEQAGVSPLQTEAELFDVLAQHGVASVRVMFCGGWDYNEQEEIIALDANFNPVSLRGLDDRWNDLIGDVWREKAAEMRSGYDRYDRYDAGEYYHSTEEGADCSVFFDIRTRTITLEGHAKVRVVRYRTDEITKTWRLDEDEEDQGASIEGFVKDQDAPAA